MELKPSERMILCTGFKWQAGVLHLNNNKKNTKSAICGLLYTDTSPSELKWWWTAAALQSVR